MENMCGESDWLRDLKQLLNHGVSHNSLILREKNSNE